MRMRFAASILAVVTVVMPAQAQTSTPEGALEEMATATRVEDVLKHLPIEAVDVLQSLPSRRRNKVMDHMLTTKNLEREGLILRRADSGRAWEVVKKENGSVDRVLEVQETFIAGDRAMVTVRSTRDPEQGQYEDMIVTMSLEGGEWRLAEFGHMEKNSIKELFSRQVELLDGMEQFAQLWMNNLARSLFSYVQMYAAIGFPEDLRALQCDEDGMSAEHACVLRHAPEITANGIHIEAYEIRYTRGDRGHFQITARPAEWGETATKSFFVDESGVMRTTSENRAATVHDEVVQPAQPEPEPEPEESEE